MPLPLAEPRHEDDPPNHQARLRRFASNWTQALRGRVNEVPGLSGQYCMVLEFDGEWRLEVCCDDDGPVPPELTRLALETCPLDRVPPLDAALEVLVKLRS